MNLFLQAEQIIEAVEIARNEVVARIEDSKVGLLFGVVLMTLGMSGKGWRRRCANEQ